MLGEDNHITPPVVLCAQLGTSQVLMVPQQQVFVSFVTKAHTHRWRALQFVSFAKKENFCRKLAQVHLTCVHYVTWERIPTLKDLQTALNVQEEQAVIPLGQNPTAPAEHVLLERHLHLEQLNVASALCLNPATIGSVLRSSTGKVTFVAHVQYAKISQLISAQHIPTLNVLHVQAAPVAI